MSTCPECKNAFVQPFVCATCGAQRLYDHTLAAAQEGAERYRWIRECNIKEQECLFRWSGGSPWIKCGKELDDVVDKAREAK